MALTSILPCPQCHYPLPSTVFNTDTLTACPTCRTTLHVAVFPALFKSVAGHAGDPIVAEQEASCFYHPQKKAVVPCDLCGRFLCALCDVELNHQHVCPHCLQSGKKKGALKNLDNHRVLYDNIAIRLAVYPVISIVFWFFTIFTAPAALLIAIRYWNAPTSLVPRTKIRFIAAIVCALAEIGGWGYVAWETLIDLL